MVDIKEKVLPILKCASKNNTNNHISEEPIIFSCGHCICKSCIEPGVSYTSIECNTCKKMNERDLSLKQEPTMFNFILNDYIQPIFGMIRDEFKNSFEQYKEILENSDEMIDLRIEFIKDQVQIRIESLKIELDKLNDSFNKKLDEIKVQSKQRFNKSNLKFNKNEINKNKFENESQELDKLLSNDQVLTKNILYDYQKKLLKLKNMINGIQNKYQKISFNESKEVISDRIVGEIVSTYDDSCYDELSERINEGKCEIFSLNGRKEPFDMCALPNGNLLVANRGLILFDKTMNVIKSFTSLHGLGNILGITTNNVDEIFFSDYTNGFILKTNLSFDKLALYGSNNQLNSPSGICYNDGFIFVCEFRNRHVQKFDSNLVFQAKYQVNFTPWYIKNCKNIACIRASGLNDLIFYDLTTFTEIKRYNTETGLIGTVYNRFYSFDYVDGKYLRCYDEKGTFISKLTVNIEIGGQYNNWGALCFYNSKLFICKRGVSNLMAI